MRRYGAWTRVKAVEKGRLWLRHGDVFVCAPPKCGGSALHCLVVGIDPRLGNNIWAAARKRAVRYYTPEEVVASGLPAFLAVRDPVERFASLWRNKCRDGDSRLPAMKGMSPSSLLLLIERFPMGNSHWAPQSLYWRRGIKVVDYRKLDAVLGLPALKVNETVPGRTPRLSVRRIQAHYRKDMRLWLSTRKN